MVKIPPATCLFVWIGTEHPVPPVAQAETPDPLAGYSSVEEVPPGAPVRAQLTSPYVTYVGSHEGCGCGFNSGGLAFEGLPSVADVLPLLPAMEQDERDEFLAEQRSRERLQTMILLALAKGTVEVYACWAGDEEMPPNGVETVEPGWLTQSTAPLSERVRYVVCAAR
jgi:hypothetical protein